MLAWRSQPRHQFAFQRFQQQKIMIAHQDAGRKTPAGLRECFAQYFQKPPPIMVNAK